MNRTLRTISRSALLLLAGLCLFNAPAYAFDRTVKFCNHTRNVVKVAAGYDKTGTSESTSAGWFIVQSCTCRKVISDSLRATEIFLFAAKSGSIAPLLNGRGPLCIHPTRAFNLIAQNRNAAACAAWGGKWVNFKFYDTGLRNDFTVTLKQPNTCNL
jgi:uncharacterized membrane protein